MNDNEKAHWAGRLIALCDVAKSAARRGTVRLDAFLSDLGGLLDGLHARSESAHEQA